MKAGIRGRKMAARPGDNYVHKKVEILFLKEL